MSGYCNVCGGFVPIDGTIFRGKMRNHNADFGHPGTCTSCVIKIQTGRRDEIVKKTKGEYA